VGPAGYDRNRPRVVLACQVLLYPERAGVSTEDWRTPPLDETQVSHSGHVAPALRRGRRSRMPMQKRRSPAGALRGFDAAWMTTVCSVAPLHRTERA
jgi:hypothetical protein